MTDGKLADIDRRIEFLAGADNLRQPTGRVSDLRELPFVVLLGEPGIGKTTVFEQEAALEGTSPLKVRELMNGATLPLGKTAFLDALDEYRVDGQPSDKVANLANIVETASPARWRLSCRSEDWRKAADIAPMQKHAANSTIAVAQLMPLDDQEAGAVLVALGETDPAAFVRRAYAMGASGFIESPLSLRLLFKSIQDGGTWPHSRFDLFRQATERLAHEFNPAYARTARGKPSAILAAAATASLNLLVAGARGIWRSNAPPPLPAGERRTFVTSHDLQLDNVILGDALNTALFRGEGEAFEPVHRSVAEFLAGGALAKAVLGGPSTPAYPLSRALALIAGWDGRAPTELRGLYAWFAAHLAQLGSPDVSQVLAKDPVSALVYGDVSVMPLQSRRLILASLGSNDPYFRASEVGITSVGSLASDDLADELIAVLNNPDRTHRLLTVFDALTTGRPVKSTLPVLRTITLDPSREDWHRWRAADAWLNGQSDQIAGRRELLDVLALEVPSKGREQLRAHLASGLSKPLLTVADVRSIIADTQRVTDELIMSLYGLQKTLIKEPWPELFDTPFKTWLPDDEQRHHLIESEHLLDRVFAETIRATTPLPAFQLLNWIQNVHGDYWFQQGTETKKAIVEWLERSPKNDLDLVLELVARDKPEEGHWVVANNFIMVTGRLPSASSVETLQKLALAEIDSLVALRKLDIAISFATNSGSEPAAFWGLYETLVSIGDTVRLHRLAVAEIEPWRLKQQQKAIIQRAAELRQRSDNIATLTPQLADLASGRHVSNLHWAAQLYFSKEQKDGVTLDGIEHVRYFCDDITTGAILQGWHHLATHDWPKITIEDLGRMEAEGRHYFAEDAALAGLDQLIQTDALPAIESMPVLLAISVFRRSFLARGGAQKDALDRWATQRLAASPQESATALSGFWLATLNAGHPNTDGLWQLMKEDAPFPPLRDAIANVLKQLPNMPLQALRSFLRAAQMHMAKDEFLNLSETVLTGSDLDGPQRAIWHFVAFSLAPERHRAAFLEAYSDPSASDTLEEALSEGVLKDFNGEDVSTRLQRSATTIRLVGPSASADDRQRSGVVTRQMRASDTVRHEIAWLGSLPDREVSQGLEALIAEGSLAHWRPSFRHALAEHCRIRRDSEFTPPSPAAINAALSGGAPVSASDLRAIVVDDLARLRNELRTTDSTPWKSFWNRDSHGNPTAPLVENECRNYLLQRLQDRLARYGITAALPEVRRGEETRVDAIFLSAIGKSLPLEAKRHFHAEVWTAASTQLQGYAAAPGSDGLGIYLVFWFGRSEGSTPGRPDGKPGPDCAFVMEQMLRDDLSPELQSRTDVLVFDVSKPLGCKRAKATPRAKSKSKPKSSKKSVRSRQNAKANAKRYGIDLLQKQDPG